MRMAYRGVVEKLERQRKALRTRYEAAGRDEKTAVLKEARQVVMQALLKEMFPLWEGTAWDFNGISETPREGAIACGYFVTTLLRDAGFRLPRIKLAQQPSQTIIRSLCARESVRVAYERPITEFVAYVRAQGPGMHLVGLDCHTGFVAYDGTTMLFVHASYFNPPRAVTAEAVEGNNPLAKSKYLMSGRLFDDGMMVRWLRGEPFEMKKK